MERNPVRLPVGAAVSCALVFLLTQYGGYFQNASFDLVQHYLLVDEIMKHAGVSAGAVSRMRIMAYYPPAAHWMAAIIGWIGGSGLVGISFITIGAAFLSYFLILLLVGASSPAKVALFAALFFVLQSAQTLVGYEVVGNFFYPQLVGDVAYFGVLFWLSRTTSMRERVAVILISGTLLMWVQPLASVHVFAAGLMLLMVEGIALFISQRAAPFRYFACVLAVSIVAAAIIIEHPVFKVMRSIAENNGALSFGYTHIMAVALFCGIAGLCNLVLWLRGRGFTVDAVIGSAAVAATMLVVLQFAAYRLHGDGSPYAVKKHMFLVTTLGVMNLVRIATVWIKSRPAPMTAGILSVIAAGAISTVVLQGFTTPVAPVVRALDYASRATVVGFPPYVAGNTAADDSDLPLIANMMLSLSAFEYPFNDTSIAWQGGAPPRRDVKYLMVANSSDVQQKCGQRYAEGPQFVIVPTACLNSYSIGRALQFRQGSDGRQYTENGWYMPEEWGVWANGTGLSNLSLSLPAALDGTLILDVDAQAYITTSHKHQQITVSVNGRKVATWDFGADSTSGHRIATIPADLARSGRITIAFLAPSSVSPAHDESGADTRVLGIGIRSLALRPKKTPEVTGYGLSTPNFEP